MNQMSQIESYFYLLFSVTGRTKIRVEPLCLVGKQGVIRVRNVISLLALLS